MIAPPRQLSRDPADAKALFAAAHRRRRRRRLAVGVACLVVAGSMVAELAAARPWQGSGKHQGLVSQVVAQHSRGATPPDTRVAWVDDQEQLHIGDLTTGTARVVARVDASPADPMIAAGGRLYWADISRDTAPIRSYDLATGKIGYLPSGSSVFAAADGRSLYIAQTSTRLIQTPADGVGVLRQFTLPVGWRMSGLLGNWAVANGVIVYSTSGADAVAVWNPGTGTVKVIGHGLNVFDTYTPAGSPFSLLAWTSDGQLGITNTATLATLTARSSGRYGFTYGGLFTSGAFSPDGTWLAVFLNLTNPQDPVGEPVSEPAILDTRTGLLTLVRAAPLGTYEDAGWARWLPGSRQLIVGAEQGSYVINATTQAARPLSDGINFSATILEDTGTVRIRS